MKKTLALVLAAVMLLSLLSACKSSADETPTVDPAETEQTTTPEETTPEEETPEEETQPVIFTYSLVKFGETDAVTFKAE